MRPFLLFCVIMNIERGNFMNYFIESYYKILSQLDNYKKDFINLNKKNQSSNNYLKYVNELDNLLLQKYVKFEEILNEFQKH